MFETEPSTSWNCGIKYTYIMWNILTYYILRYWWGKSQSDLSSCFRLFAGPRSHDTTRGSSARSLKPCSPTLARPPCRAPRPLSTAASLTPPSLSRAASTWTVRRQKLRGTNTGGTQSVSRQNSGKYQTKCCKYR